MDGVKEAVMSFQIVNNNGSFIYFIDDQSKQKLIADFAAEFHKCRKMIDWFDDPASTPAARQQKLDFFMQMPWILEGLHETLTIMLKSGIKEKDIIEALDLPF